MNAVIEQVLGAQNGRTIEPIPDHLLEIAEREKVYIHNTFQREHRIDYVTGLGAVTIQACPAGKPYGDPYVVPGIVFEHYDLGDGKLQYRQFPARSKKTRSGRTENGVVDDILKSYVPPGLFSPNLVQWGVFVSDNPTPKAEELAAARKALLKTAQMFIADGDRHNLEGNRKEINAVHREMAMLMNIRKPWTEEEQQERAVCPACGSNIAQGVAKCAHCGAILDRAKWAKFAELSKKAE